MPNPITHYFLSIADFKITIEADSSVPLFIEPGYAPFLSPEKNHKPDIIIHAISGIPKDLLASDKPIYSAIQNKQPLWNISRVGEKYKFTVFNQENSQKIQQIAIVDAQFKNWNIYMEPIIGKENKSGICPLQYPMGPLIMYYLTVNSDAIMLHASGIFDGDKGRIFSGFSGAGKTTMANIWKRAGSLLINDDRLIIRKKDGKYFIYNTPMFYADEPKNVPLDAVYLLSHSPENTVRKLFGVKAVSRLMAFCIQHGYARNILENHTAFLSELINHIPVHELGFVPDAAVIDFIKTSPADIADKHREYE